MRVSIRPIIIGSVQKHSPKKQHYHFLIVHGWSLDSTMKGRWQPLIKLLQAAGHQVEYLDLPGFDKPLDVSWDLNAYARWLNQKIAQTKNCFVIGHSFGGQIACRAAATHPKNLLGVVLIGPAGIIDRSWTKQLKRGMFKTMAKVGQLLPFHQSKKVLKNLLYKVAREQDYHQAPAVLKKTMSNVLQDEVIQDLPNIEVPVLILWGEADSFTPVKHASIFQQGIKHSQLIKIPQEGHRPYFTQPQLVVTHINQFLTDVA